MTEQERQKEVEEFCRICENYLTDLCSYKNEHEKMHKCHKYKCKS